jgi:antitoxin (DNA-binding transcriptional repressor) of toxin-antitoxin stability system
MAATATIRDLRNNFPRVRRLLDQEGEVVVTDQGTPAYRLTRFQAPARSGTPAPKDYLARLRRFQPKPIQGDDVASLHDANRGGR